MSFTNLYYKRATGTARPCFICYKPSTTCLATQGAVDFIYTCDSHLTDPGFSSRVVEPEKEKSLLSSGEIADIKAEWEERQKRKAAKDKAKEENKDNKDKDKDNKDDKVDSDEKKKKEKTKSPSSSIPGTPSPAEAPQPKHERYVLHRDIFSLRQAEHRKRRQAAAAKELAPQLPTAPRGGV